MASSKAALTGIVRALLDRLDIGLVRKRAMRDPVELLLLKSIERNVTTVLDIGANQGQFARELWGKGWDGKIVSFEPIKATHRILEENARTSGKDWKVAAPMALGAAEEVSEIGISENSVSSSILPIKHVTTDLLSETRYVGTETISVRRLDDVYDPEWGDRLAMKLDTQGFESAVLNGAPETLKKAQVLAIELSLTPLYEGGALIEDVFALCRSAGFRCIALTEGFSDYGKNEVLQVDGVFVRNS